MKKSRAGWMVHMLENENAFRVLVQIPVGTGQIGRYIYIYIYIYIYEMAMLKWI